MRGAGAWQPEAAGWEDPESLAVCDADDKHKPPERYAPLFVIAVVASALGGGCFGVVLPVKLPLGQLTVEATRIGTLSNFTQHRRDWIGLYDRVNSGKMGSDDFRELAERVNGGLTGWLNLLPAGLCGAWMGSFAERGTFVFRRKGKQLDFSTREEVHKFCKDIAGQVKAVRLKYNFVDYRRNTVVAMWEEFTQESSGADLVRRRRAFYAEMATDAGGRRLLTRYVDLEEEPMDRQRDNIKKLIPANLDRINSLNHNCTLLRDTLTSNVDLIVSNVEEESHGLDGFMQYCQKLTNWDQGVHHFEHADLVGVFPSTSMALIFFDIEKLRKDRLFFNEIPEMFALDLAEEEGMHVKRFHYFYQDLVESMKAWYKEHAAGGRSEAAGAELVAAAQAGKQISLSSRPDEL